MPALVLSLLLILAVPAPVRASGVDVGASGRTWPIAERDPVEEIMEAVRTHEKELRAMTASLRREASDLPRSAEYRLPKARREKVFYVDTEYSLPEDVTISDKSGRRFVYPAGTTYNPLDYMPDFPVYVVMNPNDPAEVKWLKKYVSSHKGVRLLVTEYPERPEELPVKSVSPLTERIARFFGLEGTVSVIQRDGERICVRQYVAR